MKFLAGLNWQLLCRLGFILNAAKAAFKTYAFQCGGQLDCIN
jgi:hypothetical protein